VESGLALIGTINALVDFLSNLNQHSNRAYKHIRRPTRTADFFFAKNCKKGTIAK